MRFISMLGVAAATIALAFSCAASQPSYGGPEGLLPTSDPSPSPGVFRDLEPIAPDPAQSLGASEPDWYKDAVFYHIWVNAFHDSDGNGVGDIKGITQKLSYLQELGITALWLSPFFVSSSESINLHMYDTTDHSRVDPRFGTNADVDELLREAHRRGIRLVFDWVPNHVSNKHPWFTSSGNNADEKRDWFVWRDDEGDQEGPWGQQVWHDHPSGLYYGVFWSGMPDVNFRHQPAKDAMVNVAISWLNRGFDGMRVDAVKYLYEDPASIAGGYADYPETFEFFQALRSRVLDAYGEVKDASGNGYHKFMVAENWTDDRDSLTNYMVKDGKPGFHMTLDFAFAYGAAARDAGRLDRHWKWWTTELPAEGWMGTFLSNHDNVVNRPYSVQGDRFIKVATALQLLGSGTPFIYYGNEIGMPDASRFAGASHADRRHRQPFDWNAADAQKRQTDSLWSTSRDLIKLRSRRASLRRGNYTPLRADNRVFVFSRKLGAETTLVALNLSALAADIDVPAQGVARFAYGTQEGLTLTDGRLTGSLAAGAFAVYTE